MPGTVESASNRVMNKTDKVPALIELVTGDGQQANKHMRCFSVLGASKKIK